MRLARRRRRQRARGAAGRDRAGRAAPSRSGPAEVTAAVAEGLRLEGLGLLYWTPAARRALRARLAAATPGSGPLAGRRRRGAARRDRRVEGPQPGRPHPPGRRRGPACADPWQIAGRLDDVSSPSGSSPHRLPDPDRLHRSGRPDPLRPRAGGVRLAQADGRRPAAAAAVALPAHRAVATVDLGGFWVTRYPAVRSELRGRYPRHPWPEDPAWPCPQRPRSAPGRALTLRAPAPARIGGDTDTDHRRVGHRRELAGRPRRGARGGPGHHRAPAGGHRHGHQPTWRSGRRSSPAPATRWRSTRPRSSARTARCGTSTANCLTTSRWATTGCTHPDGHRRRLIVSPGRCWLPEDRAWGWAVQLYAPGAGAAGASATSPTCAPSGGWPTTRAPASC